MSGAQLVVVIPMLGRPHHVAPLVESLAATVPQGQWRALWALTPGDDEVAVEVAGAGHEILYVPPQGRGDYARKVNAGVAASHEPYIFTGASDLCFRPGWWEAALAHIGPGVGVVGTNDLGNPRVTAGEHATHSLVARWYATETGPHLMYEGYHHNFVDDEMVGWAKYRTAWSYAPDSVVEHLHPDWGKAPTDSTYRLGRSHFAADRRLYARRRRLWT